MGGVFVWLRSKEHHSTAYKADGCSNLRRVHGRTATPATPATPLACGAVATATATAETAKASAADDDGRTPVS